MTKDRDELLLQVARRLAAEATPEPQPINLLINRAAGIEGVHPATAASVFWQLVGMGVLDVEGRRLREVRS